MYRLQIKKTLFDTYNESKKNQKEVNVTVLLFILYLIWVYLESPKYKMICLKSQKSSELAEKNGVKNQ